MGLLRALQARLRDGEDAVDGADGYYIRTKDDDKLGPMSGARLSLFFHACFFFRSPANVHVLLGRVAIQRVAQQL